MSVSGVLRTVDAVTVRVPDMVAGIGFYVSAIGSSGAMELPRFVGHPILSADG
jgi:hypothetical protein